jgi:hypothetical protein
MPDLRVGARQREPRILGSSPATGPELLQSTMSTTVLRTLRPVKLHPYKMQMVQELAENDPDHRIPFCEQLMNDEPWAVILIGLTITHIECEKQFPQKLDGWNNR